MDCLAYKQQKWKAQFWDPGRPRSRHQLTQSLVGTFSLSPHIVERKGALQGLFYKGTNPMTVSSPLSNHPLKPSPPDTIILGIQLQHRGFGGNKHSVYSILGSAGPFRAWICSKLSLHRSLLSCLSRAQILPDLQAALTAVLVLPSGLASPSAVAPAMLLAHSAVGRIFFPRLKSSVATWEAATKAC